MKYNSKKKKMQKVRKPPQGINGTKENGKTLRGQWKKIDDTKKDLQKKSLLTLD